jgi:hypothetical protein
MMQEVKPQNRKDFTIEYKMEDGSVLEGLFTVKRLAIKDRSRLGRRKSELSGGMYCVRDDAGNATGQGLDEDTDYLNSMIAHLEVALLRSPEWFNLDEIADIGLVTEIYNKVVDFETSFFRTPDESGGRRGSGELGEGNGSTEHPGTGPGGTPTQVVGTEVQAALDA